jgi:hypothetical protein
VAYALSLLRPAVPSRRKRRPIGRTNDSNSVTVKENRNGRIPRARMLGAAAPVAWLKLLMFMPGRGRKLRPQNTANTASVTRNLMQPRILPRHKETVTFSPILSFVFCESHRFLHKATLSTLYARRRPHAQDRQSHMGHQADWNNGETHVWRPQRVRRNT